MSITGFAGSESYDFDNKSYEGCYNMKLNEQNIRNTLESIERAPEIVKIDPVEKERFIKLAKAALEDYAAHFGEEAEFDIRIKKRFTCIELIITVPGKPYNPLLTGRHELFNDTYRMVSNYLVDRISTAFFTYALGKNTISVRAPRHISDDATVKTTILAIALGILCGIIMRMLPESLSGFLINDLVTPVSSLLLAVMSGIMGPVLFLSLLKSVTMLNDISELNSLGRTVIKRFVIVTLLVMVMAIMVCLTFFGNFRGTGGMIVPDKIISMILDVVPTNLFKPFVEGKIPQIIVLALGLGAALLMIGERGKGLKGLIGESSVWLNTFMRIVGRVAPAITFLNLTSLVASGKHDEILNAWKYIVAVIICMMIYAVLDLCFVSVRHSLNPFVILKKLKPLIIKNFAAHSSTQTIEFQKETAVKVLGIKSSFVEFWVPMSFAMFYPYSAICGIAAAFCAAQMSGTAVTLSFLLILFIVSVQLSLSSSSVTSSMVIIFGQLGLPVEYVGLFNACGMIVRKIASVFSSIYSAMEELDVAFKENAVDEDILRGEEAA